MWTQHVRRRAFCIWKKICVSAKNVVFICIPTHWHAWSGAPCICKVCSLRRLQMCFGSMAGIIPKRKRWRLNIRTRGNPLYINEGVHGKIIYNCWICFFHCHVWLLEATILRPDHCNGHWMSRPCTSVSNSLRDLLQGPYQGPYPLAN